jgi:hypothetical protein
MNQAPLIGLVYANNYVLQNSEILQLFILNICIVDMLL